MRDIPYISQLCCPLPLPTYPLHFRQDLNAQQPLQQEVAKYATLLAEYGLSLDDLQMRDLPFYSRRSWWLHQEHPEVWFPIKSLEHTKMLEIQEKTAQSSYFRGPQSKSQQHTLDMLDLCRSQAECLAVWLSAAALRLQKQHWERDFIKGDAGEQLRRLGAWCREVLHPKNEDARFWPWHHSATSALPFDQAKDVAEPLEVLLVKTIVVNLARVVPIRLQILHQPATPEDVEAFEKIEAREAAEHAAFQEHLAAQRGAHAAARQEREALEETRLKEASERRLEIVDPKRRANLTPNDIDYRTISDVELVTLANDMPLTALAVRCGVSNVAIGKRLKKAGWVNPRAKPRGRKP